MEIIKYGKFKSTGKQKKKSQIILTHTSRNITEYLLSLKFRYNGKFKRIPNYIITREGEILQLLSNISHSEYFTELNINRNSIIISLENLGWLQKEPLKEYYVNWIGDIYKGVPFERKWRDYFFWHPYTTEQVERCFELCDMLLDKFSIDKKCIGHNTKTNYIERYEGVVTKSNFDTKYTDLSPAFDFETFEKKFKNEQFA